MKGIREIFRKEIARVVKDKKMLFSVFQTLTIIFRLFMRSDFRKVFRSFWRQADIHMICARWNRKLW